MSSRSLPTFNISQYQGHSNESVLHISWPKYWVSASASVLSMNIQDRFPLGLIGWISLRDSQESPPTPQFKSISSSALSFPWYLSGKEWLQCRRWGLIPGLERSLGGGNGNPLQYSCLGSHPFSFKPLLWFRLHWGLLNWLIVLVN